MLDSSLGNAPQFSLGEDQIAVRDMARSFAAEVFAPHAVAWDEAKHFPVAEMRQAAELGMGGVYISPEVGGSALSRLDATLIFEALATGCPTVSAYMSIHNMAAWMIDAFGSEAQRQTMAAETLHHGTSGELLPHRARRRIGRRGARDARRARRRQLRAQRPEAIHLGRRRRRPLRRDGAHRRPGPVGISTLVVPGDTPGISLGANERKMGWNAQPTRAVVFQDARVPVENRLGEEGIGFKIAMAGLDGGRLNIAACSLGGAQIALDKTLAYMKERKAFGKRLDEFQALQFRLADMATALEASRTFLWRAAAALDRKEPNATQLCAMAKRFVTDACFDVANQALQLHGGYGYLSEFGIEKIVRDLRVHQILEGTNEIMRLIVARSLVGR